MMRSMMRSMGLLIIAILVALAPNRAEGQMEKRSHRLYLQDAFVLSSPAPGQRAPDMVLKTLDGKDCCLSDYFGQTLVIVKGSYT